MSLSALAIAAEAEHGDPLIPYVIGGVTLAILLFMLLALVWFGAGREHS